MPHKPGIGAIFGIVSEDGVAKPGFPVNLYDRTNGKQVAHQTTDGDGGFVFNGLNPDTNDYQVVAQDEDNPPYKNALIRDRIQPVPGYQGATFWGNWRQLAFNKQAEILFDGSVDGQNQLLSPYSTPAFPTMRAATSTTLGTPYFANSITPGAPDIPALDMQGQKLHVRPRTSQWSPALMLTPLHQNPSQCSLEWVADFSTLAPYNSPGTGSLEWFASFFRAGYNYETENLTYNTVFIYCRYTVNTKTFTFYRNSGSGGGGFTSNLVSCGTFDFSAYAGGVHHCILTISYGVEAIFYVDGVAVATFNLAATNGAIGYYNNSDYGTIAGMGLVASTGSSSSSYVYQQNGVMGLQGPMACYPYALTADDVSALYQALMVGSTPVVTGYAKEVVIDRPTLYARLNDMPGATSAQHFLRPVDMYNGSVNGTIIFGQPTMIAGGNGALFNGTSGVRFNSEGCNTESQLGYTLEWVGRPTAATPAAIETLFCAMNTSEARTGPQLQRLTTGQLRIIHSASGTETLDFASTMSDTANDHHFMLVIDKVAFKATLYVDGVQAEQIATNTNLLDTLYTNNAYTGETAIGGIANDANVVSAGFAGKLAEVAFYQMPLSALRAKAHYDARNTA